MSQLNRHSLAWLLLGLLLLLGGCTKEVPVRFVWPPPPEQPRLEFIGNYYSEASFEKSAGGKLFAQFVGDQGLANFSTPYGIVSDGQGIVYISDIHLKNVRVYDFNKKTVNFLTKETVMGTPLGLALDSQGNLYIADAAAEMILVYGPDHRPRYTIKHTLEMSKPAYLAVNERLGRLYVSDGIKNKIFVFSLSGTYLFSIGELGDTPGKFFAPQGLTFGPDGNLYVADMLNARIQVLTAEGVFVRQFGERGDQPGQFENPKDLKFDSDGNLHIVDGRRSDLLTFTPEGRFLLATGGGTASNDPLGFGAPRSLAIDATDRIYVAEATSKRFSVWQYMGAPYLAQHPFTDADLQRLLDYLAKIKGETRTTPELPVK